MFKRLALGSLAVIGLLVVALLCLAASKPDVFRVQRSAMIVAPPEQIFPLINDLHRWTTWSPYEEKDPKMKRTYSGAESGKGAIYTWDGNDEVGSGRMEIAETTAPKQVKINLHFIKPFTGDNVATFDMAPQESVGTQGAVTKVTWSMEGPSPFISKIMQVFINMDEMCGKDFEKGLAKLKGLVEKKDLVEKEVAH